MALRITSLMGTLLLIGQSASASTLTIGAYAVANHSSCSAGNIPGTIRELDKFFADANFPADAQKNFYWKDSRVRQNEWVKESDNKVSSETSNGFDGADASLLTYIASHGVTSGGVYKALAGSKSNGGCYISTPTLELGDNSSRYTILSTCQGLKIGTGDNPSSTSGENPSKTWKNASKGLNCIFGYSNNMADKDTYGTYLLAKIKNGDTPLAEAFLTSSEAVSADNIPAVLCYGETQEEAAAFIRDNKSFDPKARANTASAFVYRVFSSLESGVKAGKASFPSQISLEPVSIHVDRVSRGILGSSVTTTKTKSTGLTRYESEAGTATYEASSNVFRLKNNVQSIEKMGDVPNLEDATEIATNAVQASGLTDAAGALTVSSSTEDVLSGDDGAQRVISRKIRFKQQLAGFQSTGQAGSVEVTVGEGGVISQVTASLFRVTSTSKSMLNPATISASNEDYEATAIQRVAELVPGGAFKVIRTNFGYDVGNFFEVNRSNVKAVAEVTLEASFGGFSRRYIEKIEL